jgi:hypothetical protein
MAAFSSSVFSVGASWVDIQRMVVVVAIDDWPRPTMRGAMLKAALAPARLKANDMTSVTCSSSAVTTTTVQKQQRVRIRLVGSQSIKQEFNIDWLID